MEVQQGSIYRFIRDDDSELEDDPTVIVIEGCTKHLMLYHQMVMV
jgi:hypothetical protein